jgi:hypothetical protein
MKKMLIFILLMIMLISLTGCAPGDGSATPSSPAGFWSGIWHGIFALIFFGWSWFNGEIGIYEPFNNGFWYNLGYLISLGVITYSTSNSVKKD